jgi:hypothetical protein
MCSCFDVCVVFSFLRAQFIDQCKRAERKPEQVAQLKEWRSYLAALTAPKTGTVHRLWHSFLNESNADEIPEHS